MNVYIDFSYYRDIYFGTYISEDEFPYFAQRASRYIDRIITKPDFGINEQVKMAVCAVCDTLKKYECRRGVEKESNDGYSICYDMRADSLQGQVCDAARLYIDDELIYRGLL